ARRTAHDRHRRARARRGARRPAHAQGGRRQGRRRGDAPVVARVARVGPMITDDGDDDQDSTGGWVPRPAPRRGRRITAVILVIVLVPLFVFGGSVAWFFWELGGHGKPGKEVHVNLERGWGVPRIGEQLEDDGVIGSAL